MLERRRRCREGEDFPGGPVAKTPELPMQGAQIGPLLRELDRTCYHRNISHILLLKPK